jgi:hypothetical protein
LVAPRENNSSNWLLQERIREVVFMPIALMAAALAGGLIALAVLWPFGVFFAVLGAPFGGSLAVVLTALALAGIRARVANYRADPPLDRRMPSSLSNDS